MENRNAGVIMTDVTQKSTISCYEKIHSVPLQNTLDVDKNVVLPSRDGAHFFCGAGASAINIIVTFPINKVMFRQQLFGFKMNKAVKQIIQEGVITLYRGLPAPLLQKSMSTALMFGLYHQCHQKMTQHWNMNDSLATLCASLIAGSCEATLTPFERVQVLLLTPKHHDTFKSTFHTMATLHKYNGVREYYRGLSAILIRNGFSNAIFFGLRKPIKTLLPEAEETSFQNSLNDFISGALIGALCSTMFYPVNVIKTRMQSNVGGQFISFYQTFFIVHNERNREISKLFRGCHVNIARSFISWGIINASFEVLMKTFYAKK